MFTTSLLILKKKEESYNSQKPLNITFLNLIFNNKRRFTLITFNMAEIFASEANKYGVDFSNVRVHENMKRALEAAATGGHNIIIL